MQLSQPTLEPHSLCYTCWVQVVYSPLPLLYFFLLATLLLLSSCRHEGVRPALPGLRGLLGASSPSRRPCGAPLQLQRVLSYFVLRFRCIRHFVINVINNIRIRSIISSYVICAMRNVVNAGLQAVRAAWVNIWGVRHVRNTLLSFGEFLSYLYFASAVSDIFVINVIYNIRTHFIIYFYMICAVIYCSFCCERASRPLVGFGVLIDNTIKGLTCLYEIMSMYLICGMIYLMYCKQMCMSHWQSLYVTSKTRKGK